jgi:hypothetical protein
MKQTANNLSAAALPRRDLMAIFAYIDRTRDPARCVDGTFERPEAYLDRLAAAARMQ